MHHPVPPAHQLFPQEGFVNLYPVIPIASPFLCKTNFPKPQEYIKVIADRKNMRKQNPNYYEPKAHLCQSLAPQVYDGSIVGRISWNVAALVAVDHSHRYILG